MKPEGVHPFSFRTRPLSSLGAMVLHLRESSSSPEQKIYQASYNIYMSEWADSRKLNIAITGMIIIFVIVISITFVILYEGENCKDGILNQNEEGVDCGGACPSQCILSVEDPIPVWGRAFRISNNAYAIMYYIENTNPTLLAMGVPYTINILDAKGKTIDRIKGSLNVYPKRITPVFIPFVETGKKTVDSVSIEFDKPPNWVYYDGELPKVSATDERFQLLKNGGVRANAIVVNDELNIVNEVDVYGVIFDNKNNAVAAASTYIETLNAKDQREVTFTWVNDIEDIEYVCDGSGEVFLLEGSGSSSDALYGYADRFREILGDGFEVSVLTKPSKIEWDKILTDIKDEKEGDNLGFIVLQRGGRAVGYY